MGSTILYKLILQDWWYSWCLPYSATRKVKTQASLQSHTLIHYNSCSTLLIYVQACSLKTLSNSHNTMFHTLLFEDTSQLVCSNSWMFYTSVFQNTFELFSFFSNVPDCSSTTAANFLSLGRVSHTCAKVQADEHHICYGSVLISLLSLFSNIKIKMNTTPSSCWWALLSWWRILVNNHISPSKQQRNIAQLCTSHRPTPRCNTYEHYMSYGWALFNPYQKT